MTVFLDVEARALITGETVVAFLDRHSSSEGDELPVVATATARIDAVKPAYRRWVGEELPDGEWSAVVEGVHPAALLDPESGSSRHVLLEPGNGDLLILRVFDQDGVPVLSDHAFEARVRSIEGALSG